MFMQVMHKETVVKDFYPKNSRALICSSFEQNEKCYKAMLQFQSIQIRPSESVTTIFIAYDFVAVRFSRKGKMAR